MAPHLQRAYWRTDRVRELDRVRFTNTKVHVMIPEGAAASHLEEHAEYELVVYHISVCSMY